MNTVVVHIPGEYFFYLSEAEALTSSAVIDNAYDRDESPTGVYLRTFGVPNYR